MRPSSSSSSTIARLSAALVLALCLGGSGTHAQQAGTDDRQQDMLNELRQIRQLLQALLAQIPPQPGAPGPAAPQTVSLKLNGPRLGRPDAPIAVVEFTDLQCPYCRQFHVNVFEQLKANYVDTGKIQFFSRDFPLEQLHPMAMLAARANRCASDQGKFWEMRHGLLINNERLSRDVVVEVSQTLGLARAPFETCVDDAGRYADQVRQDLIDGRTVGVSGTPSFVVGKVSNGVVTGVKLSGSAPYSSFAKVLDDLAKQP